LIDEVANIADERVKGKADKKYGTVSGVAV
jgi:hypothetical protein